MTSIVPDSHQDLLQNGQIVSLATIGPNGEPQVTALWFLFEDGVLKMSLNESRQKMKNMLANSAVSAFFVDPASPFRTLELRGTVSIEADPDYILADKVGAKYSTDLRNMDQPGQTRYAVTLNVEKVHAFG